MGRFYKIAYDSMEVLISNPNPKDTQRALALLKYCQQKENGDIITGCGGWKRNTWIRLVGIYPINKGCDVEGLWRWQGEDLQVILYDIEAEQRMKELRARGKHGAVTRWARGGSRSHDRGDAHSIKRSEQNKIGIAHGIASANADKIREDKKEINKEKSEELKGLDSPEMSEIMAQMKKMAESHTLK